MGWFSKPRYLFPADKPDVERYIGRTIVINGQPVTIKTIRGNRWKPAFYDINGKYQMNILRFYAQINGDRSISEKEFQEFEEIEMTAEKMDPKKPPKVPGML